MAFLAQRFPVCLIPEQPLVAPMRTDVIHHCCRDDLKGASLHEQFCMTSGVDAVISKETFDAVQSEKKRRSNIVIDESGSKQRAGKKYSAKKKKDSVNDLSTEN